MATSPISRVVILDVDGLWFAAAYQPLRAYKAWSMVVIHARLDTTQHPARKHEPYATHSLSTHSHLIWTIPAMEISQDQLGKKIRELRIALAISQEALAELTNLHRTYIGSVERGERNVSLKNILTISRALKTTPSSLLQGIE
jgi:DNA-binding XRE family transcriptional regulator